jgi:hypothetical protein
MVGTTITLKNLSAIASNTLNVLGTYNQNPSMRGIIEVSNSATPGRQATPPSSGGTE